MIERFERVIHPGWLTIIVDDRESRVWMCHHRCVDCGFTVAGSCGQGRNILLEHSREHNRSTFALELYQFFADLNMNCYRGLDVDLLKLNIYFGNQGLEWPDRNERGHRRTAGLPL